MDNVAEARRSVSSRQDESSRRITMASTTQHACRRIGDDSEQQAETHETTAEAHTTHITSEYLIQGKTTFNSHEVRALRSSIPTKNIKNYLRGRHNWDDTIFRSIAWEAYASAIRSLDANMHTFVVKLCDNWLPVGQRLIKYGNTYDHCSLCQRHESYDHDVFKSVECTR
jgi:hypothetical protein